MSNKIFLDYHLLGPNDKWPPLPDHTQLPESDGSIVQNFLEHPQAMLLTQTILPVLRRIHPDEMFAIGSNSGIYWRLTDPPLVGCKAPDWFYIPNVPPTFGGQPRRSYVMWYEPLAPLIILEFASGDGTEERDTTPNTGKFWVYEQGIRSPYYGIFGMDGSLELFQLLAGHYQPLLPNDRGHFPITPMGVELGVWYGKYLGIDGPWMRWWDEQGQILPMPKELNELEHQRAEQEHQRAEQEHQRAERERIEKEQALKRAEALAAKLRELGIEPDSLP
jgi:Uma2 family endonuclease